MADELGGVFESVSRYFSLLSEPMRLRILHTICERERSVSEIVHETGANQTNISRHLNFMHRAGVLTRRKDGVFIYYGVADTALTEICRTVCVHIAARAEPQLVAPAELMRFARDLGQAGGQPIPGTPLADLPAYEAHLPPSAQSWAAEGR